MQRNRLTADTRQASRVQVPLSFDPDPDPDPDFDFDVQSQQVTERFLIITVKLRIHDLTVKGAIREKPDRNPRVVRSELALSEASPIADEAANRHCNRLQPRSRTSRPAASA